MTFIDQLRRQGAAVREVVVRDCSRRFRALFLTDVTTVLGLQSRLFATGSGAEIQRPSAVVGNGGLLTAAALTLIALPVIYSWAEPAPATPQA